MPILEVNNTEINYVTGEDGISRGKKNLLFVHGGGGSHKPWLIALRHLKGDCNRIAVELPGHGESKGDGERDIDSYTEWIKFTMENLSLDRCIVVGHSMGGAIALSFALKYPQSLDGIILVGTGPTLEIVDGIRNAIKERNFGDTVKAICKLAYADSMSRYFIEMGEKEMLTTRPDVLYGDISACQVFDVVKEVHKINVPTLIVCGSEDKLTSPGSSYILHEKIKGSKLAVIRNAGHMVMIEKPREFNRQIEGFIAGLPAWNGE